MRRSLPLAFDIAQSIGQDIGSPITGLDIAYQALLDLFSSSEEGLLIPSINDARAEGKLWQDAGQTTLATEADDPVGYIEDYSGNGNDLSQGTATARPLLKQDGDGNWYLQFDGTDDFLDSSAIQFGQDWTAFVAAQQTTGASVQSILDADPSGSRQAQLIRMNARKAESIAFNDAVSAFTATDAAEISVGSTAVITSQVDSGTLRVRKNAVQVDTASITGTPASLSATTAIGYGQNGGGQFYHGRVYGALVIADSATAFTDAENYLASQSGVTL